MVHDADPLATNSAEHPDRIAPQPADSRLQDGQLTVTLPAVSWVALRLSTD
jgi:alpha-N-arabinofuranosidase